jgi:hypothetical protein
VKRSPSSHHRLHHYTRKPWAQGRTLRSRHREACCRRYTKERKSDNPDHRGRNSRFRSRKNMYKGRRPLSTQHISVYRHSSLRDRKALRRKVWIHKALPFAPGTGRYWLLGRKSILLRKKRDTGRMGRRRIGCRQIPCTGLCDRSVPADIHRRSHRGRSHRIGACRFDRDRQAPGPDRKGSAQNLPVGRRVRRGLTMCIRCRGRLSRRYRFHNHCRNRRDLRYCPLSRIYSRCSCLQCNPNRLHTTRRAPAALDISRRRRPRLIHRKLFRHTFRRLPAAPRRPRRIACL